MTFLGSDEVKFVSVTSSLGNDGFFWVKEITKEFDSNTDLTNISDDLRYTIQVERFYDLNDVLFLYRWGIIYVKRTHTYLHTNNRSENVGCVKK